MRFLKRVLVLIYKFIFNSCGSILPKNDKLIMFESFLGKQYSDNPRAIYEYMQNHNYPYTMYWSIDRKYLSSVKNEPIKVVPRFSIKWLFLMTRAKYWVTNSRLPLWLKKPRGTRYIQTWHGTPLKRLASDMEAVHMPGTDTETYKKNFLTEAKKWDYLISPNPYSTEIFTRAFQFKQQMIESGYPRNDFLVNKNNEATIHALKEKLNIPLHKKVLLYAPTWRDNQFYHVGRYKFNLQLDLQKMQETLGKDYVLLLRLHYLVAEQLDLTSVQSFAYDVSHYPDIRDLYLVSDVLITDYSSVFFDYAILKRPMIFYVYDLEEYRDHLRGFYFDLEKEAPGPLVKTTEDLIQHIKQCEQDHFRPPKEIERFYQRFCTLEDGRASQRVVEKIWPFPS